MHLKKNLGKQIKLLRKTKGFTQEKLADLIKIDPKSVSKIENGNIYPAPETLESIIDALEVEPWELFVFESIKNKDIMMQEIIDAISNDEKILISIYQSLALMPK